MFMAGPRLPELIILVVIVLLIFGPGKLPSVGRGFGEMIRGFKQEADTGKREDEEASAKEAARKV